MSGRICGGGRECENVCPIMRAGRNCPMLTAYLAYEAEPTPPVKTIPMMDATVSTMSAAIQIIKAADLSTSA